ncbi:MAG: sulfatase [Verrucomicrobiales bacterium]|nr:sulfatase [Verrucomicrobiales bacterium]
MRLLTLLLALATLTASAAERPNILFILADDLGWSDTTLYGQTALYETPNLERLAAMGMTFTRAYTPNPLCSPTRSSILTGKHPARTGLTAPNCHTPPIILEAKAEETAPPHQKLTRYTSVTRLDPKYDTLAELLRADGYATAHFGKWHLGAPPYSPLENGFEIDVPHHPGPGPAGSFIAPWKFKNGFKEKVPGEHIEDRIGDEAVAFLEQHKDEPFFLNYWQFSVHAPFDAKPDLIEKYRSKIDPNDAQRSPTYAAMVQSLDENVGKMLDALDRLELTGNTIIVFTSDNGGNMYNEVDGTTPTSNRPLRGGKANNWDGGVRVPTVVVAPGITEPGSISDQFVISQDFYPTLLGLAGVDLPETELDGIDLRATFEGKPQDRERIFTFFPHSTKVPDTLPPSAAAYEGDWKLLRLLHHGENGVHEDFLFHLADDIGERNDLAAAKPDRAAAMAKALERFLADTGAVYPLANPNYDPAAALLNESGISPLLGATLAVDDTSGIATLAGEGPNLKLNLTLKPEVAPGDLTFTIKFRSPAEGRIDLRWAEKGVKPLYFNTRLKHSKRYAADAWIELRIPFAAEKAVTQMRVDFMQPGGIVEIDTMQVTAGSEVMWKAGF